MSDPQPETAGEVPNHHLSADTRQHRIQKRLISRAVVGGGPLLIFENQFPKSSWQQVSLRGDKSNSLEIGCEASSRQIYRELYPVINFLSQRAAQVSFGLGDAKSVDRLTIHWPSGKKQVLADLPINSHSLISESSPNYSTISQNKVAAR